MSDPVWLITYIETHSLREETNARTRLLSERVTAGASFRPLNVALDILTLHIEHLNTRFPASEFRLRVTHITALPAGTLIGALTGLGVESIDSLPTGLR